MSNLESMRCVWLNSGDQAFSTMLEAIDSATTSVRLETYIFTPGVLADRIRDALIGAAQRGARVRVLIDAWGSQTLASTYWDPLIAAGGHFRWFNPLNFRGLTFRDHRKLLVCDESLAVIGGFNIAPEYEGDGVTKGWRDLGLLLVGTVGNSLAAAFDDMWEAAAQPHPWFMRLRKSLTPRKSTLHTSEVLLGCPGRGFHPIKRNLVRDLKEARDVRIMAAYYLPTLKIRRALKAVVRNGGRVQLLLPAQSDVAMSQQATRFLYKGLLNAGMEIYEYQPQILHAKLILLDDIVYVGSSNLDTRSLNINYEILLRARHATLAAEGRRLFESDLRLSRRIELRDWQQSRTFIAKLKEAWSYFILARADLFLANRMWRSLR